MNRQQMYQELSEVIKPFAGAEVYYDKENIRVGFLNVPGAHKAVEKYADEKYLFATRIDSMVILVSQEPFVHSNKAVTRKQLMTNKTPDDVVKEVEVLGRSVVEFKNKKIDVLDDAVHALMEVERHVPEAGKMQASNYHMIHELKTLKNRLSQETYKKHMV